MFIGVKVVRFSVFEDTKRSTSMDLGLGAVVIPLFMPCYALQKGKKL
jgi:hypothetical protein